MLSRAMSLAASKASGLAPWLAIPRAPEDAARRTPACCMMAPILFLELVIRRAPRMASLAQWRICASRAPTRARSSALRVRDASLYSDVGWEWTDSEDARFALVPTRAILQSRVLPEARQSWTEDPMVVLPAHDVALEPAVRALKHNDDGLPYLQRDLVRPVAGKVVDDGALRGHPGELGSVVRHRRQRSGGAQSFIFVCLSFWSAGPQYTQVYK